VTHPKWQAIGVLLGVFALGIVSGGGAVSAWQGKQRRDMARLGFGPLGNLPRVAMMRRLDLTAEQRRAIEGVLMKHAPERRAIMRSMVEKCGQEFEQEKLQIDGEIRAILTSEQRAKFDELATRQREHLWGHAGPRNPHHGP
jgi:Spy/CpxP family protein refolding chaperone